VLPLALKELTLLKPIASAAAAHALAHAKKRGHGGIALSAACRPARWSARCLSKDEAMK